VHSARRRGFPVELIAVEVGVPIEAVRWWFPDALVHDATGRWRATPADTATRLRPLAVDGEVTFVPVKGSAAADRVSDWFDVQWRYVTNRATAAEVEALPNVTVAGRRLERDPGVLEELARRGDFDLDDIYRDLFG
jgi:hypothetical protein